MQKYDLCCVWDWDVFETAKMMIKTNQDITEEQCIRILTVSNKWSLGQKCLLYIGPSLGKFSWKLGLIDYWYLLIFLTLFFIYSFIYWFIYLFTYLFFLLTYLAFCFELLFYLSTISVTFSHNLFYIIYYIYISLSHMFLTCSSLCYNIIIYLISMYLLHIN